MTTFKDLESLQLFLKQDAKRVSLNPVRFINVDSMAMWIEVKKFLLALADETLPLSKFCEGKDTTPNIKRVSAALKKVKKSQFVSPLSEYLRIIPEQAEPVIQKFIKADYQNNDNGKLRIYFLMYRMKSLLRTVPSDDPRAKDCIVLFETDEESDYKLTIIQKDLDVKLAGNRSSRCNQGIILFQNTMMSIHLSYLWMEWVLNMLITWRISSPTLMSSSIQYSLMLVFAHYRQSQKSTKTS